MADRVDFFFRQRVTESELDLAFAQLESADRNLAADLRIHGVISGAVPSPHSPVPNLSVDLTAPARAYDPLGQRIFFGSGQTVDCAIDRSGLPTDVVTAGSERWLGIFLRFARQLSEPRTDGNSQQVFFRRDEAFEISVRQAPEGPAGAAPKPALEPDELLLCDVRRRPGQTQILANDIDASRRQAFIFAQGTSVGVETSSWSVLSPVVPTAQSALDAVDAALREHFTAAGRRHAAGAVDYAPHGFVTAGNVQAALDEVIDDLGATAAGSSGATRIGVDAVAGTPHGLAAGSTKSQLAALLGFLNAHVGASAAGHAASAIGATAHHHIAATNVQAQLQEMVTDLLATSAAAPGAGLVGVDAIAGAPLELPAGTVRTGLATLLEALNGHVNQPDGAHAASAVSIVDANERLDATDVESAFVEILDAYSGDHFRGNASTPGQHRTIRQPVLGVGRVLLWDSRGSGDPRARLRVYADSDGVWFLLNASWTGTLWARDDASASSSAYRLGRSEFEFLHDRGPSATFASWPQVWRLPMASTLNSAFELAGSVQERGRLGMHFTNAGTATRLIAGGGAVTFRARFANAPTSITLSVLDASSGFTIFPSVYLSDRDGFAFFSNQSVAAGANAHWTGSYTAIA